MNELYVSAIAVVVALVQGLTYLTKGVSIIGKIVTWLGLAPVRDGKVLPPTEWSTLRRLAWAASLVLVGCAVVGAVLVDRRNRMYEDYLFQAVATRPLNDVSGEPGPPPLVREFAGTVRDRGIGFADEAAQEAGDQLVALLVDACYLPETPLPAHLTPEAGSIANVRVDFPADPTTQPWTVVIVPTPRCAFDLFYRPVADAGGDWQPIAPGDPALAVLGQDFYLKVASPHHLVREDIVVRWGVETARTYDLTPVRIPIVLGDFDGEGDEAAFKKRLKTYLEGTLNLWVFDSFAEYRQVVEDFRAFASTRPQPEARSTLECFDRYLRVIVKGWYGSP